MQLCIIVADPHKPSLRALSDFLREQPDFSVVGEAEDSHGLLELLKHQPVDVAIIEYELPGIQLIDLIDQIHKLYPSSKVILLSSNVENARLALSTGADSFISKSDQSEWLLAAIHRCEKTESDR